MRRRKNYKQAADEADAEDRPISFPDPFGDFSNNAYKELLDQRTILINGEIKDNLIERVVIQINKMSVKSPKEPITILINSFGGSVFEAQAIIDAIQTCRTPITTMGLGKVMSAAFDIFLAGDYRVAHENTVFMCHAGSENLPDDLKIMDLINESKFNEELLNRSSRYYASRTKTSFDEWKQIMESNKDRYFFAEQAKKMGVAHDIIFPTNAKHMPELSRKRKKKKKKTTRNK